MKAVNTAIFLIAAAFIFVLMAGPGAEVLGQQKQKQNQQSQQDVLQSAGMHKASDLIGKNITSQQNESLGEIEDVIINSENGEVKYIVISRSGMLGMGGKTIPITWDAADLSIQQDKIMTTLDDQTLRNAPAFDSDQWTELTEPDFDQRVRSYFGDQQQQQQQRNMYNNRNQWDRNQQQGQDREQNRMNRNNMNYRY